MPVILAIDPGEWTGSAVFTDGFLTDCGVTRYHPAMLSCASLIVVELPCWRKHSPADPNDLITLARKVGRIEERASECFIPIELVTPSTWKGSVPKRIHNKRVLDALSAKECEVVDAVKCAPSVKHNMIDAIGLGLWRVGRDVNK